MSKFTTKGVEVGSGMPSKYVTYGNQILTINSMEPVKAKNTDSYKVIFHVESPAVEVDGFEPDENALNGGKVGRVHTRYLGNERMVEDFIKAIAAIGQELGVKEQLDAVDVEGFEAYIAAIAPILTGKPAWFKVTAEEYDKAGSDKPGIILNFARFRFVSSLEKGEGGLATFDKNDKFDYRALASVNTDSGAIVNDGEGLY